MKTIAKLNLLLILVLMLVACQPVAVTTTPQATTTSPEVAPTTAPVEAPTTAPVEATASPTEAVPPTVNLAGTSWVLSALDGSLPVADTVVTLQFNADGTASGSDGCNQFSTTYTQNGANLTIQGSAAATMMACPEPVMNQAAAYMTALGKTTGFSGGERQLILTAGNTIVATFVAVSQDLSDTAWDVTFFNNGQEAIVSPLPGTEISANFGTDGSLAGNASCNQYITSYTTDGNTIAIGTPGVSLRFCPEPEGIMGQEFAYLAALESAATFRTEGDTLEMRTAGGQIAVIMTRMVIVDLPEPKPEPQTPTGTVIGAQVLNIRSGPGTNFPVIGAARTGDQGEIVGRSADGRWWAVSIPSAPGGIGWVSSDFVLATHAESVPVLASPPTPTPRPTNTPAPPRPTNTPAPQATATPVAQLNFSADRTNIQQGQCATLSWSVQNVQAVWVYPRGEPYNRFPRTGQGSEVVCPSATTTYEMRVLQRDGSVAFRQVTINVTPIAVPPTPVPPPASSALPGTRWEVVNFNDGNALATLLPGTRITLEFGTDGQMRGNASCNSYFAPFQSGGNSLTISRPGSTSQFCQDPAGIMDQETRFLNALPRAASYRIDGNRLDIRSAADQIIIVATR